MILNCAVFGSLMRPLNIVVTENDENNDEKKNNLEPGVNSVLDINHIEANLQNFDKALAQSEIIYNKDKTRSVSESQPPVLEDLLPKPLHNTLSHSSQKSIFVPPMSRKDIFYSGSTINLKTGSKVDINQVLNHSKDRRHSHKLSIRSDSMFYEKNNMSDTKLNIDRQDDMDQSCSPISDFFDLSVMKETVMILLIVANIFGMTGYYIPFVYITQHARKCVQGITSQLIIT